MTRYTHICRILLACASLQACQGATTIDWSSPTISLNTISSTHLQVTGYTTGDHVINFTADVTTVNGTQDASFTQLGNVSVPLNLNIPATRTSATLMTVDIRLDASWVMVSPTYTLLDVDASNNSAPYSNWRDRVVRLGTGVRTYTPVSTATVTVTGDVLVANRGNIANNSNLANVLVNEVGPVNSIRVTFGPATGDLFGNNQRFGFSNITMTDIATPEPGTGVMAVLGVAACAAGVRRRRKIIPDQAN